MSPGFAATDSPPHAGTDCDFSNPVLRAEQLHEL